MPEISQPPVIAIQALDREVRALRASMARGDAATEECQLLDDRMRAADDLRQACVAKAKTSGKLPPYHRLVVDFTHVRSTGP